ncbi:MAG: hypothetical protein C1941_07450 [Prosthecochloris sp.]|nr:hypothetical protein [Prosthecochloris sp.]
MTQIRNIIIAVALLTGLSSQAMAASTSGTTNVSVRVPEFIALHFYSNISLNFAAPTAEAIDEGSNDVDADFNGNTTGNGLDANSLMNASLELDGTKTSVKLNNVWAVRGFSKSGNARVEITVPSAKLQNGTSEITMSNVKVSDDAQSGSTITTKLNGISKGRATTGNIDMDLDFSNTTRSGSHTGAQYTITATTI